MYHPHYLIPPKVDHLPRDALVFPWLEEEGGGAVRLLESFGGDLRFQRPLEFFTGVGGAGKKGLADVEGLAIVIRIQEPGGYILATAGMELPRQRVVDVHAAQFRAVCTILFLFHADVGLAEDGEDLTDAVH